MHRYLYCFSSTFKYIKQLVYLKHWGRDNVRLAVLLKRKPPMKNTVSRLPLYTDSSDWPVPAGGSALRGGGAEGPQQ